MTSPRDEKSNLIEFNHYQWPAWLFYTTKAKNQFISPAATFNPVSALQGGGNPWQTTTSPSATPKPKTLILTRGIFVNKMTKGEWFALMSWLQQRGFTLYFCVKEQDETRFVPYESNTERDCYSLLHQLTEFDRGKDHEVLAKEFQIDPRQAAVLDKDTTSKLVSHLNKKTRHIYLCDPHTETLMESMPYKVNRPHFIYNGFALQTRQEYLEKRESLVSKLREGISSDDMRNVRGFVAFHPDKVETILNQADVAIKTIDDVRKFTKNFPFLREYILDRYGLTKDKVMENLKLHPQDYDDLITLITYVKPDIESLKKILAKYAMKINHTPKDSFAGINFSEVFINISKMLTQDEKLQYQYTEILAAQFSENISNTSQLSLYLDSFPHLGRELMDKYWHIVSSPYAPIKGIFLKASPEKADELLKFYLTRKIDAESLAELLAGYPAKAPELIAQYSNLIFDEHQLYFCISKVSADLAQILLAKCQGRIGIIARNFPELVGSYLIQNEEKIDNGDLLYACLKAYPQQAQHLIELHVDKIKNVDELVRCCSAVDASLAEQLIKKHATKIICSYDVALLIEANDKLSEWLLKAFHYAYSKESVNIISSELINASPENIDLLLEDITDGDVLYDSESGQSWIDKNGVANLFEDVPPKIDYLSTTQPRFDEATYLYLDSTSDLDYILYLIKTGEFKNIVMLEISIVSPNNNTKLLFQVIKENCPLLKRMILPRSIKTLGINLPDYEIDYRDAYEPEKNKQENINDTRIVSANQGKLYVAIMSETGISDVTSDSENNTFQMVSTGELLNLKGKKIQRLRTAVAKLTEDFTQEYHVNPVLTQIRTPVGLNEKRINAIKKENNPLLNYYLLSTNLAANTYVRLLSVDADEKLLGVNSNSPANITFFRGEDGFYYAKSNKPCHLQYLIETPTLEEQLEKFQSIPDSDPIKAIIDNYKQHKKFKMAADADKPLPKKPAKQNTRDWLQELYYERSGVCRHRCYAVYHEIYKDSALRDRVRLVHIDNNHMELEVLYNNKWHLVNLGGGDANLVYDKIQSTYTPPKEIFLPDKKIKIHAEATLNSKEQKIVSIPIVLTPKEKSHEVIFREDQLDDKIFKKAFQKQDRPMLMVASDVETQANSILKRARLHGQPLFYLDKPGMVNPSQAQVNLESGLPVIEFQDELDRFLEAINDQPQAMILINWDAFNAQERVALNTLIDREKSLFGRTLPDQVHVVSLCAKEPKDNSFLSRHQEMLIGNLRENRENVSETAALYVIDAQGFPDWKSYLFGQFLLIDNELTWKRGPLVELLESTPKEELGRIEIINLPNDARDTCDYFLKQAKARGEFSYHEYTIPLTDSLAITTGKSEFDFKIFPSLHAYKDMTVDQLPKSYCHVNTILFDYLLTGKSIAEGKYQSIPGWLEQAKEGLLSIYITSPLTDSQWYCLFTQANRHHVKAELYLAPGVELPPDSSLEMSKGKEKEEPKEKLSTQYKEYENTGKAPSYNVFVTNQTNEVMSELVRSDQTICIAIEDYNYQDLIEDIRFQYSREQGFHDFNQQKSDLMSVLQAGKEVILYGQFTPELLQALEPYLHHQDKAPWPGRLLLVIEDQSLRDSKGEYPSLRWLPREGYHIQVMEKQEQKERRIIFSEPPIKSDDIDLHDSENQASEFMKARQGALFSALAEYKMVQLVGPTGVGKSHLMDALKINHSDDLTIYHELGEFEKWANDKDPRKDKILFIDESNIEDKHLTLFAPLKNQDNPRLLYRGKLYELTLQHKVVFARNPHSYGGGRNEQKLFVDNSIPEIHLNDMPPAFIYENVIKPVFDELPGAVKEKICKKGNEDIFKKDAALFLEIYLARKKEGDKSHTVRELQEWVLNYAAKQRLSHLKSKFIAIAKKIEEGKEKEKEKEKDKEKFREKKVNKYFIPTPSTMPLRVALNDFIRVRRQQHEFSLPGGLGLNAFLIEGRPGIGKSELVRHMLQEGGYQLADRKSKLQYYKLDASLSMEEKKKILVQAFNEGNAVWLDEVNSCLDDGLEKILNSLLSGFDPDTGERAKKSGFMLFVTANSISMEGRSLIGPALRGRMVQRAMPQPEKEDFEVIIRGILPLKQLPRTDVISLAAAIHHAFQQDANATLREYTSYFSEWAERFPYDEKEICKELKFSIAKNQPELAINLLENYRLHQLPLDSDLLLLAISSSQAGVVKAILEYPHFDLHECLTARYQDNKTILHLAAETGDFNTFYVLMQNIAHLALVPPAYKELLKAVDDKGNTLLDSAMQTSTEPLEKKYKLVSFILKNRKLSELSLTANIASLQSVISDLHYAAKQGNEVLLKLLLVSSFGGRDFLLMENEQGESILDVAIRNNKINIVKLVLENEEFKCIYENKENMERAYKLAAELVNVDVLAMLHYNKNIALRPDLDWVKTVLKEGKKIPRYNQAGPWIQNSTLDVKKYDKLSHANQAELTPTVKARYLLTDYVSNYRFLKGHWGRHGEHIEAIKKILKESDDNTPFDILLDKLRDNIALKNKTGELGRRIHYIRYHLNPLYESKEISISSEKQRKKEY